jgi:hypothetical protein
MSPWRKKAAGKGKEKEIKDLWKLAAVVVVVVNLLARLLPVT